MSVRRLAPADVQPKEFAFSADNLAWANKQVEKYPAGRQASAIIPLLWRAQKQAGGWLPEVAIRYVADFLAMPHIRALEVATFYTMFNLEPVGRFYVQLCGTTPCMLRGAEDLKRVCRDRIGEPGHVTTDGTFSWLEVECLGACVNAPMVQINDDFYEDLNTENFNKLLDDLAAGRPVKVGPQIDRQYSAPAGEATTLTDPSLYQTNRKSAGPTKAASTDAEAKKPTKAASDREAPAPKPPLKSSPADKSKPKAR